jgi:hypothetical protein
MNDQTKTATAARKTDRSKDRQMTNTGSPTSFPENKSKSAKADIDRTQKESAAANKGDKWVERSSDQFFDEVFESWDENGGPPTQDLFVDVSISSLESAVGYSSLFRQMHRAFIRRIAFYKTPGGGSLSTEEARKAAFHACRNEDAAKECELMRLPLENLNFVELMELQEYAPRAAEWFWERCKLEGLKEFESGHLAANITFPVGHMTGLWNIARYLGLRESFVYEWKPRGGIEIALIDMLAQTFFQWQYWLEQTVKRSQTREHEEHPDYSRWKAQRIREDKFHGVEPGYWFRPRVSEQEAIEHAVQMADRWNRMFMRTLRQLRDLRRYAPVTIHNPAQVNIAGDGGQQVNLASSQDG